MSDNTSTLRSAREAKGLSPTQAAAALGISVRTLERWESGATTVKGYRLAQLAQVYTVELEELAA